MAGSTQLTSVSWRDRLRLQRAVERLHDLPARVNFEFLLELAETTGTFALVVERAEAFATLDPDVLRAVGGDRFPPLPLRVVP